MTEYDVVVIGSGLGGLSAAALLARAGLHVAVVERNEHPGGYAQVFRRGPYLFDPAIHFTLDAGPRGFTPKMLAHLGVADRVRFVASDHTYRSFFPGLTVDAKRGRDAFLATHQELFPADADGLARLFRMRQDIFAQLAALPQKLGPDGLAAAMETAPLVFRHRMSSVEEVLAEYLRDTRTAAAVASIWPYVGSPPARMSFLLFNQMLESLHEGCYYAVGSFQTLVDALAAAVVENGGDVLLGGAATKILVRDGRAVGVEVAGDTILTARAVVSNADPQHTFGELLGWEHAGGVLRRRIGRYHLSPSAVALYGILRADPAELGLVHENFVFPSWDHGRTWSDLRAGRPGGIWVSVPTLLDPSLAATGEHLSVVTGLVPARADGSWRAVRDATAEEMLRTADGLVPGLRDAFEIVEIATPDTLHRYTNSTGGAIYGWENIPAQTASKRLAHRTPVDGLFLSGQWSEEGTSSLRVLTSGRATAALVAGDLGRPGAVPDLGGPSFLNQLRGDDR
ncbi:phytoene desaturase family protein [Jiangella endophytica]|uniref:phytoene desaturase family protein n=1 Tax=Jiangella endophytica TaxID=1623398 RepID=UPI000E34C7C4|nr:NAD(P)/FAD-dependent oxidoreductase [Jiangella endophytica]